MLIHSRSIFCIAAAEWRMILVVPGLPFRFPALPMVTVLLRLLRVVSLMGAKVHR